MKAIEIIGRLRERYSNKYTKTPNHNKDHYINWLQDEYAELAMNQANGTQASDKPALPIQSVTHRALQMKIEKLEAENKLLAFMVENGLGEEDMRNDITLPHEI